MSPAGGLPTQVVTDPSEVNAQGEMHANFETEDDLETINNIPRMCASSYRDHLEFYANPAIVKLPALATHFFQDTSSSTSGLVQSLITRWRRVKYIEIPVQTILGFCFLSEDPEKQTQCKFHHPPIVPISSPLTFFLSSSLQFLFFIIMARTLNL